LCQKPTTTEKEALIVLVSFMFSKVLVCGGTAPLVISSVRKHSIMGEGHGRAKLLPHGCQEAERERERQREVRRETGRVKGQNTPLKGMPSESLPPTRPHLVKVSFGINLSTDPSIHELITHVI
jgi:hypothetical protein